MKLFTRVSHFISLDNERKLLFLEAFFYLGWARLLICLPFPKIAPMLGAHMQETSEQLAPSCSKTIRGVQQAIQVMSRHTCWESKCLVRAIAAMKMLQRRNLESTLYLGTSKNELAELTAHAWLRCGSFYITGAEVMEQFTVVGKFAQRLNAHEGNPTR